MPVTTREPLHEARLQAVALTSRRSSKVAAELFSSSPRVALLAPVVDFVFAVEDVVDLMAAERQLSGDPAALQGHHSSILPPLS